MHFRRAWTPCAARAGGVQLRVKCLDAVGHGFEDGGHVGVFEVEVQSGRFADESQLGRGHGHGGWGFAAEKLRFESVQMAFKVDQFIRATAARHLTHELVDRSAPGGFDITSGSKFGDGPLLSLAK